MKTANKTTQVYREKSLDIEFTGSHAHLNKGDESYSLFDFLYSVRSNVLVAKLTWLLLGAAFASPFIYFGINFLNLVLKHH